MDVQMIVVFLLFGLAAFYIGKMLYSSLKPKKDGSCGANCKCGADFSNVPQK